MTIKVVWLRVNSVSDVGNGNLGPLCKFIAARTVKMIQYLRSVKIFCTKTRRKAATAQGRGPSRNRRSKGNLNRNRYARTEIDVPRTIVSLALTGRLRIFCYSCPPAKHSSRCGRLICHGRGTTSLHAPLYPVTRENTPVGGKQTAPDRRSW